MKNPGFLHADRNFLKLKIENYWSGHGHKWVCQLWSQDLKCSCISRRN